MEGNNQIVNVAIVEDDDDIRSLLRILIDNTPGYSCKDAFPDGEAAVETLPGLFPDVVLMDIELPGESGIQCVHRLKDQMVGTDFVMLTNQLDDDSIFESLRAGASGYLLKDTPPAKLLEGISVAAAGGSPISPSIARKVTAYFRPGRSHDLTEREFEILKAPLPREELLVHCRRAFYQWSHRSRSHQKYLLQASRKFTR